MAGGRCSPQGCDLVGIMRAGGHSPGCAATARGMIWFCHRCGRYGRVRMKGLRERCGGAPVRSGVLALERLEQGLHPDGDGAEALVLRGWAAGEGGRRFRSF